MKKLLLAAAVAPLFLAGAAQAASSASADITLSANVNNTCYIVGLAPLSLPSGVAGTSAANTTSGAVTISYGATLADTNTALALSKTATYSLNAYCNYASHDVGLKSVQGGLVTASNPVTVGNFDHRINYTANFTWGAVTPTITTSGNLGNGNAFAVTNNQNASLPTNVNSTLTITTTAGTDPLVQGTYGDTLKVSLGAAL